MDTLPLYAPYLVALTMAYGLYLDARRRTAQRAADIKRSAIEAGLSEPLSLHPVIDAASCLGCGTCTLACPEGDVLGLIGGKADLIEPSHCIGHGACRAACPTDAIRLVFGSAERGVDLPVVGPDFQSNVPGIFIAGELGGMGLIRNAVTQGQQAVAAIASLPGLRHAGRLDLVIVGAGPAGISAALAAKQKGLSYCVIEQDDLGGTVFKYPRGKVVMTAPAMLPIVGQVNFREVSKEKLLAFWKDIENSRKTAYPLSRTGQGHRADGRRLFDPDRSWRRRVPGGFAGHRPPRHAPPTWRSRREPAESSLSVDRSGPVPRQACFGCRRWRFRA